MTAFFVHKNLQRSNKNDKILRYQFLAVVAELADAQD